jgi:hypothetical protein
MSLSERLRAAELDRQRQADLLHPPEAVIDLSDEEPVVDLIDRSWDLPREPDPGSSAGVGISYEARPGHARPGPGAGSSPAAGAMTSPVPCPRCGGGTQVDLFDEVHQTYSLSCNTCFHMFRHDG